MSGFEKALHRAALMSLDEEAEDFMNQSNEPIDLSPYFQKRMRKLLRRSRRPEPFATIMLRRVAITLLAIFTALSLALMSVPSVRAEVKHAIIEFFEKYLTINISGAGRTSDTSELPNYEVTWLPEGFELVDESIMIYKALKTYLSDTVDLYFRYEVIDDSVTPHFNSEGTVLIDLRINGMEGWLLEYIDGSVNDKVLIWHDGIITFQLTGSLSREELIRIAESAKRIT